MIIGGTYGALNLFFNFYKQGTPTELRIVAVRFHRNHLLIEKITGHLGSVGASFAI